MTPITSLLMKKCNINVGCGPWDFGTDWVHVDGGDQWHLDSHNIYLTDYRRDSVDLIYSSHLIEYFDRTEVIDLLNAWYKVLKPGGVLQLSVPDWDKLKDMSLIDILGPLYGKMRMGNTWIYHKTVYDYDSLSMLLFNGGFGEIEEWVSTYPNDCSHADISLNLKATK